MIRRVFTFASALSLLLWVAIGLLWVRSYWRFDSAGSPKFHETSYEIASGHGGISLSAVTWLTTGVNPSWSISSQAIERGERMPWSWSTNRLGFAAGRELDLEEGETAPYANTRYLVVPHWLLFILSGLLPALWIVRLKRRPSGSTSECPSCGYDLRASKDRCPECGTPVAPPEGMEA